MTAYQKAQERDRRRKRIAARQKDRVRRSLMLIPDPEPRR